jgi:hypothetical protein
MPKNKLVRSVVDAGICSMFVAVPDVDVGTSLFLFAAVPDEGLIRRPERGE